MRIYSNYGKLYGFLVRKNKVDGLFFQVDKNGQICDIFNAVRNEGIKNRVRGVLFDTYKGRPFSKKLFQELIEVVTREQK